MSVAGYTEIAFLFLSLQWLNNCVGRKNYSTFVALMATSLSLVFSLLRYWMTEIELGSLQTLYWKFFFGFSVGSAGMLCFYSTQF